MIGAACFCGEDWNVPAKECKAGHPMTAAEVEVVRLRAYIETVAEYLPRIRAGIRHHAWDARDACDWLERQTERAKGRDRG